MKFFSYEIYGEELFGRMQHINGMVKVKDKHRAEEFLRELYDDELNIKWINIYEVIIDDGDEEENFGVSSYYDE